MCRKIMMTSMVMICCVFLNSSARGAEAPKIISWSNSKSADSKTVFQVKPGEKIIFSVKADGAEEYRWWVDKSLQKAVKGESFQWTVPNRKGLWKIHVTVTNKVQDEDMRKITDVVKGTKEAQANWPTDKIGDWGWGRWPWMLDAVYPSKAQKEWIVSTYLKEVKPAESIQAAVDSVPSEGGIVLLGAGTHKVPKAGTAKVFAHSSWNRGKEWTRIAKGHYTKPLHYDYGILLKERKNILIAGAGREKTALTSGAGVHHIFLLEKSSGITFRDMLMTTTSKWSSRLDQATGVRLHTCSDITLFNVKTDRMRKGISSGVGATFADHRTDNVILNNCIFTHGKMGINWNHTHNSIMKDSEFCHMSMEGICFNTASSLHVVVRCRLHHNCMGVCTYSNNHFVIKDNICYGNWANGIQVQTYTRDVKVLDNVCFENGRVGRGGGGIAIVVNSASVVPRDVIISNNISFNNNGPGLYVSLPRKGAPITFKGGPFRVSILSNTIFGNKGDGIVHHPDRYHVTVRDNIIANNAGYGISLLNGKSTFVLSHNNVWKNAKGNYNGLSAGAGDMSVAPLFADPKNSDFHLKSKAGRWDLKAKKWVKDRVHSPCIDAGDPKADFSREPASNGGRVNLGAYGNTKEASKSAVR